MPETEIPRTDEAVRARHEGRDLPAPLARRLGRLVARMADDLALEGDQRQRFEEIQMRFFRRSVVARHETRRLQQRLRRELTAPQPQRARTEALLAQAGRRHVEIEAAFVDAYFETHELLDAERFTRYRRILVRMRRMRDEIDRGIETSRRQSSAVESER